MHKVPTGKCAEASLNILQFSAKTNPSFSHPSKEYLVNGPSPEEESIVEEAVLDPQALAQAAEVRIEEAERGTRVQYVPKEPQCCLKVF